MSNRCGCNHWTKPNCPERNCPWGGKRHVDTMRAAMPTIAQIVDQFRELMVDGGKVIYAEENGHVIDRRTPEPNVFDIPPGYCTPYEPKVKK